MSSIALVTPTYRRDLELCTLLCESVDRYVTSYHEHYLLVADEDLPLFAKFNSARRTVVPTSQMLPSWLKPLPRFIRRNNRRYWWSLRTRPVSGWHVQQFLKIAASRDLPHDRFCILDSDVVFFRPFDLTPLLTRQPAPLYHAPGQITADSPLHAQWVRSTHQLLGLGQPRFPADDFIGHIITWDRQTVRAMTNRIEHITGLEWVEALCQARDISEYMLYGSFVRNEPAAMLRHRVTTAKSCLSYWDAAALDKAALEQLLKNADKDYVAFSAASFSQTPASLIRDALNEFTGPQRQVA